jgi:predicted amino acid-binding ACT domain protein
VLLVAALVLTLGFAFLAHEVELAVIIGAFVAGLALGRTRQSERIERDLSPLANFFVPIFFVSVGLEVDITKMADAWVLALAGALLVAAVVGKLVGGIVVRQGGVDRLLVGIGMVPRGEVGLIFATIGLSTGVLDEQLYAALLVVVLVTTVVTPPAIKARIHRSQARSGAATTTTEPDGGWLESVDGVVRLRARPADEIGLAVAFGAAEMAADDDADDQLVEWMSELAGAELTWSRSARAALADLLANGNRRSWRLLDATGLLAAALPDLADEFDNRRHDTALLDPAHLMRLPIVERLADLLGPDGDERARSEAALLAEPKVLYLAALALDLSADYESPADAARDLNAGIGTTAETAVEVGAAAQDAALLRLAAAHLGALGTALTPDLVAHIATVERARRIYLLGLALGELDAIHRAALEELYAALVDRLAELSDPAHPGDPVELRRTAARGHTDDPRVAARIATAAPVLVVMEPPETLAADLELLAEGRPLPGEFRVAVQTSGAGEHRVVVAGRDTPGLFARIAQALAGQGCDLDSAVGADFADGSVLDVFRVRAGTAPDPERLPDDILSAFADPLPPHMPEGTSVTLDAEASPWFTVCTATCPDRPGALAKMTAALCARDVDLHRVWVITREGLATCRFDLTDRRGRKLDPERSAQLLAGLATDADGGPDPQS